MAGPGLEQLLSDRAGSPCRADDGAVAATLHISVSIRVHFWVLISVRAARQ